MIAVMLWALLLLLTPSATPQQGAARSSTTVEGVVLRAGSGEPLPRAQITLVKTASTGAPSGADASGASRALATTSGVDGKFVFKDIEPGSYRIGVARNGYARQEYGQRGFGGQGRVITVARDQSITGLVLELMPAGSVSGTVKDGYGEPLAGAQIQVLRSTYNGSGQRTLQSVGGDRTNDRGEYRVYWITPGRYYVAVVATTAGRAAALAGTTGSPNEVVERPYPTSYYPGTGDVSQASAVDVQPGVDLTGLDLTVPQQDLFRVRGRVLDVSNGRQPESAAVSIVQRGSTAGPAGFTGSTATYSPADGTFEVRDVAPGAYWLRATIAGKSTDPVLTASATGRTLTDVFVDTLFSDRRAAQIPIDVFGDIDGVELTAGAGVSIPGSLSVDGRAVSGIANLDRVTVTLRPTTPGMIANPSRHRPIGRDGTFTLENVLPGEYAVSVYSLPPDYYVKDVRIESTDALDRLLVSGPPRGALSIVLGASGGRIDGVVVDEGGRAVPGTQAALVPARRPARSDLYLSATTDGEGRFVLRGIPPGDYRVLAWEALEAFGYFDEDVLRLSEPHGASVRISDSSTQRVEVKVIAASQ